LNLMIIYSHSVTSYIVHFEYSSHAALRRDEDNENLLESCSSRDDLNELVGDDGLTLSVVFQR